MKHILVFNDDDEWDRAKLKRMNGSTDLCLALWDIKELMFDYNNKEKYDTTLPADKVVETLSNEINGIIEKFNVNHLLDGL